MGVQFEMLIGYTEEPDSSAILADFVDEIGSHVVRQQSDNIYPRILVGKCFEKKFGIMQQRHYVCIA